ncbi:DNA primase [Leeia oryzae]|uniref:DNA primase n=1 Tax=Leeia oryzae TaxID=356662 RepID=UPI00036BF090|nr:DNA primase [Leeia oryzae]
MIPQSFIDDLLARADIVSVIDRYVPLKKTGINYSACCPFHQEKTPSFSVSPAKQFYHCFGCGANGNALGFVMEYQGLGFVDAVKQLAADYGMTVPDVRSDQAVQVQATISPLIAVLEQASQFYRTRLKTASVAIDYLKQRGLTGEIAARFGLGFAPDDWQGLGHAFPDYETRQDLSQAGLVIDNDQGRRYDRFRDRVMFPIHNLKGQIIGFGGRVIGKGEPKYLNSPETPVFEKGRELYGLYQARQAIRQAGKVMIVEGYMDVVALAQYGVNYAVATLGTSTTSDHLQKLFKHSEHLVFCFDGDNAGRKAAWRALENALPLLTDALTLEFLFLPEGEDPDTLVRQIGHEAFEAKVSHEALPLSRFMLQEVAARVDLQKGRPEDKARFWHEIKPLLNQIAAPTLRNVMWTEARNFAGLMKPKQDKVFERKSGDWKRRNEPPPMPRQEPKGLEDRLLAYLLLRPVFAASKANDLARLRQGMLENAGLQRVLEFLQSSPRLKELDTKSVLQGMPALAEGWRQWLGQSWISALEPASEEAETEFTDICLQLEKQGQIRMGGSQLQDIERKVNASGFASLTEEERASYKQLILEKHKR